MSKVDLRMYHYIFFKTFVESSRVDIHEKLPDANALEASFLISINPTPIS